jgi:glycosyltransferase involved in cell wall biosynthesis
MILSPLSRPRWINRHYIRFNSIEEIPEEVFSRISENLKDKHPDRPAISICVIGYNEEKLILSCLSSLSEQKSDLPIEIIVSNNNSSDRMQELIDRVGAKSVIEKRQGVGWARQAALELAKGEYILNADADVIYPPTWADEFVKGLNKPGVAAVFSVDSYIPDAKRGRISLAGYEFLRDVSLYLRSFKRPELNVGAGSFGFRREHGLQIGWRTHIKRGEDGAMAYALKQFGKISFLHNSRAQVWSTTRSLEQTHKSLGSLVLTRLRKESGRIKAYFVPEKNGYKDRDSNLIKKPD